MPLMNPELFLRVGVKPPKGVLLYGPPGTGKTLLAKAVASTLQVNFLKVVSSAIVDKYIGESARLIREMFCYAKEHEPCIIFMDEIDAIGGRRFSEGTSADREIQRTLMELLNQMDGFDYLGQTKLIMATNRPDTLDPALLRPGRLDRKIEIPLPNEQGRLEIIKIHAGHIAKHGDIDYEAIVKLSDGFNGADLRNVCTEAGMFAIREERDYCIQEDFMKAVRKLLRQADEPESDSELPEAASKAGLELVRAEFETFAKQEALPLFCLPSIEMLVRCNRHDLARTAKSWGGIQALSELLGYRVSPLIFQEICYSNKDRLR